MAFLDKAGLDTFTSQMKSRYDNQALGYSGSMTGPGTLLSTTYKGMAVYECKSSSSSLTDFFWTSIADCQVGDIITISFYAKATSGNSVKGLSYAYPNVNGGDNNYQWTIPNTWTLMKRQIKVSSISGTNNGVIPLRLNANAGTVNITHPCVEYGAVAHPTMMPISLATIDKMFA